MKKTYQITGIHCRSCKILIEEEIGPLAGVKSISVDHQSGKAELDIDEAAFRRDEFETRLKELGYEVKDIEQQSLSISPKPLIIRHYKYLWFALFALLFAVGYYLVQNFGGFELLGRMNDKNLSLGLIFVMGLLASFHCVGMCGPLVVAYTVKNQNINQQFNNSDNLTIHLRYNSGRIISYAIIGAILGGFGAFFGINPSFGGTMIVLAGIFMILMGLSILTNFRALDAIRLRTPDFIAKYLFGNKNETNPKGPFIIGLLNGLMPCAPLQAMQLYALTSGSIIDGASAMLFYGLGTVPLMFGFGSVVSVLSGARIRQIVKISGVVVIVLGVMMIGRGLASFGYEIVIDDGAKKTEEVEVAKGDVQVIKMAVTYSGYQPNTIKIKKGVPVRWEISGEGITGCTNAISLYLPNETIERDLKKNAITTIEFTPTEAGEIKFSCWMKMVWGKFIVTE